MQIYRFVFFGSPSQEGPLELVTVWRFAQARIDRSFGGIGSVWFVGNITRASKQSFTVSGQVRADMGRAMNNVPCY